MNQAQPPAGPPLPGRPQLPMAQQAPGAQPSLGAQPSPGQQQPFAQQFPQPSPQRAAGASHGAGHRTTAGCGRPARLPRPAFAGPARRSPQSAQPPTPAAQQAHAGASARTCRRGGVARLARAGRQRHLVLPARPRSCGRERLAATRSAGCRRTAMPSPTRAPSRPRRPAGPPGRSSTLSQRRSPPAPRTSRRRPPPSSRRPGSRPSLRRCLRQCSRQPAAPAPQFLPHATAVTAAGAAPRRCAGRHRQASLSPPAGTRHDLGPADAAQRPRRLR